MLQLKSLFISNFEALWVWEADVELELVDDVGIDGTSKALELDLPSRLLLHSSLSKPLAAALCFQLYLPEIEGVFVFHL